MSPEKTVKGKDLKADLVIIGGGGAGLAAAVAAAEKGAGNIRVLEKRGTTGGNSVFARGIFATESPAQKRAAIDAPSNSFFKIAMNYAHWKSNPRIVRAYIDKSGDTIRWLEDKGLHFECGPLYFGQSPLIWHIPVGSGDRMMKTLAGESQRLGVKVLTGTPAKKILRGSKGNITGVLAETKGEEFTVATESVIIATGGYGGNRELLKKHVPYFNDDIKYGGIPDNTGDGLLMATGIGAATEGLGLLMIFGPRAAGSISIKFRSHADKKSVPLGTIAKEPNTLWVNKKGQRFIDETAGAEHIAGYAIVRQDNICYTLFDEKLVQIMTGGLITGQEIYRAEQRAEMPGLEEELKAQAAKGVLKMSEAWEEIADWIGAAPAVLKTTINEYNAACDQGHDHIFAKDRKFLLPLRTPPYYAIRGSANFGDTIGGIKINEHMEVLDEQDNPIPGLFAAGVAAGGWEADAYCAMLSGTAAGFALNSGRMAGENAAAFIQGIN